MGKGLSSLQVRILHKLYMAQAWEREWVRGQDLQREICEVQHMSKQVFHRSIMRLIYRGLIRKRKIPTIRGTKRPYYCILNVGIDAWKDAGAIEGHQGDDIYNKHIPTYDDDISKPLDYGDIDNGEDERA